MLGLFLLVAGAILIWTGAAFAAGRAVGFVAGMRFERRYPTPKAGDR